MTFVWKHPNYYKQFKEQQASENNQESENNQDKDSSNESQDPQPQE
jgi:hypothetical protein